MKSAKPTVMQVNCPDENSNILTKQHNGDHFDNGIQRKNKEVTWKEKVKQVEQVVEENKSYKWDIVWANVILLGGLHVCAVYGLYLRWHTGIKNNIQAIIVIKLVDVLLAIGTTAGLHRLWAHKSYEANTALQCLLMYMASLTYQNSVYVWVRDHRLHHKCSETDGDPHNAKRGFFFSHVGWLLVRKHPDVIEQGKDIDMSDLQANKIVMFQHKYYYRMVLVCAVGTQALIGWYFDISWHDIVFILIIYKFIISINIIWCINSVAHLYGKRPYDKNIGPTEATLMKYTNYGEGFHNYHHTFPWDYKAAEFGNDSRNITACFIDFFAWLGWAKNRRVASPELIEKRCSRTGGIGREQHMRDDNPNKILSNITSALLVVLYIFCT